MYLTQFEINTKRRQSRALLASAHRLHAAVLASFPGEADTGRVLWRLDQGDHGRRELWISSVTPPDLSALVEGCGWPASATWRTADTSGLLGRLAAGQRWRFRLTANPVVSKAASGGRGRVVPLTLSGCLPWLEFRAPKAGFTVADGDVLVSRLETLRFQRGNQRVVLRQAQFDGSLTVTDPVALRGAMHQGIGRARGYGCGLMTLAPVS
ncbi:MAG: type I-E CRISPR-associated protein Cas6/Cse3/CasE [Propioniciclava sp.]